MKKRSSYRPKGIRADAHDWVIGGMQPVTNARQAITDLRLKNHLALECLRTGSATAHDINMLVRASNMAIALEVLGLGKDWKVELEASADALLDVARRGSALGGHFILRGPELTAINLGMSVHDMQLDATAVFQFEAALKMERKALAAKRGRFIELEECHA